MKKFLLCLVLVLVPHLSEAQTEDDYFYDNSGYISSADSCLNSYRNNHGIHNTLPGLEVRTENDNGIGRVVQKPDALLDHFYISSGNYANVKEGDVFTIYNIEHSFSGIPCDVNSRYLGFTKTTRRPLALVRVIDTDSFLPLVQVIPELSWDLNGVPSHKHIQYGGLVEVADDALGVSYEDGWRGRVVQKPDTSSFDRFYISDGYYADVKEGDVFTIYNIEHSFSGIPFDVNSRYLGFTKTTRRPLALVRVIDTHPFSSLVQVISEFSWDLNEVPSHTHIRNGALVEVAQPY